MRTIEWTGQFKRDYGREARGRYRTILDRALFPVVDALADDAQALDEAISFIRSATRFIPGANSPASEHEQPVSNPAQQRIDRPDNLVAFRRERSHRAAHLRDRNAGHAGS
jgi:hypothetical protein